ncbi:hypothetical protein D3C72_1087530 [compost metagenome]
MSVNTLPRPTVLRTVNSPPMMPVSMRQMVRPRPVPESACSAAAQLRSKGRKMRSRSSAGMPRPLSSTSNNTISAADFTRIDTCPSEVNFSALLNRLIRICRSRFSSICTMDGSSAAS